jgi:hypothetical protein
MGAVLERSVGLQIWRFFRNTLLVIVGLVVLGALAGGAVAGWYWWRLSRVTVTLKQQVGCAADFPLNVTIYNGHWSPVHKTYFVLRARAPGYSTDVVSDGYRSWDKIIEPYKRESACWAYPGVQARESDKSKLEWSVELRDVTFGG